MKMRSHALVLATTSVAAVAQSTVNTDPGYAQREDDDDFPWGLLGLLGLKRRDDDRVNRTTDRR